MSYALILPGTSGNYVSTPDISALDITGDIDLRFNAAADTWTPTAIVSFIAKWISSSSTGKSYFFYINTSGTLGLNLSPDGSTVNTATSSATVGFGAGTTNWVRVTWQKSSGNTIFYTSVDGTTWTQLGTTQTIQTGVSIFSSSSPVEIGSVTLGTLDLFAGRIYQAQIYNGIAGTLVANPSFAPPTTENLSFISFQDIYAANGNFITTNSNYVSDVIGVGSLLTINVDSILKKITPKTYQVDTDLRFRTTKTHSVNALFKIVKTKTYLVDAWILLPGTRIHYVDAITIVSKGGIIIYTRNTGEKGVVIEARSNPLSILKIS